MGRTVPLNLAARALDSAIKRAITERDFTDVEIQFYRFGQFLLLIGGDTPVSGIQTFTAGGVKRVT